MQQPQTEIDGKNVASRSLGAEWKLTRRQQALVYSALLFGTVFPLTINDMSIQTSAWVSSIPCLRIITLNYNLEC